ncbi:MAG: M28 family peptidase [Bacteroidales bacterium]|nr:M28 family peptidase [Bacteroidales bacterium]
MKTRHLFLCGALLLLCATACRHENNNATPPQENEEAVVRPDFSADSAYAFVAAQCAFGPRVPNTEAHRRCGAYLRQTLERFCDTVYVQEYSVRTYNNLTLKACNLIGCFNPQAEKRILVAAHWDSRPYADHDPDPALHRTPIDGANDGGSGVGVLLETARQLSLKRPETGVDILFFDAEDYGSPQDEEGSTDDWCLGSQYWAKHPHVTAYKARFGILLDMVGGQNAVFCKEGTSAFYAQDIQNRIWNYAARLGHAAHFSPKETPAIIDDHLYINQITSIPVIDIIEYHAGTGSGFNPNWHTVNDRLENIDRASLQRVGEVVLYTLYNE